MVDTPISKLAAAGTLTGSELAIISQLSASVTKTATTISALASDNSFNDSGSGFLAAGFAVDDYVRVAGFTGNVANNIFSAKITALTAGKMTIGGTDGDVIVDDAAGESVTITKWVSRRAPLSGLGPMQLLETLSPSAASSVDIESFAGLGFAEVWLVCDLAFSSDGAVLQARSKHNGTYQTASNYHRAGDSRNTSTTSADSTATGSSMQFSGSAAGFNIGNDTNENYTGRITFRYPDASGKHKRLRGEASHSNTSGALVSFSGSGMWAGTDAGMPLQGVRLMASAGNMTGTIKVFGIK